MCHFKRKELKESNYYNKRCLELDPNYVKAHYRKIQILMNKNKYQKALMLAIDCFKMYQDKSFGDLISEINQKLG